MRLLRGEYLVLIATVLAALGWVASKQVVSMMPAAQFIGGRFLLASILLVPFCWQVLRHCSSKVLLHAFGVGIVLGVHLLLWIYAVTLADGLGEGAFIMSLAMLFAPLLGWALYRQPPSAAFWLALPLAMAGMALLSLSGGWQLDGSQGLFLVSALLLSLHFNLNKRLTVQLPPLSAACVQLLAVGLLSLTVAWALGATSHQMTSSGWGWFIAAAVLATSVRYVLQSAGQARTDTGTAAVIMLIEPIWTLLFSVLLFDEALTINKVGGGLLILSALLLYRLRESRLLANA